MVSILIYLEDLMQVARSPPTLLALSTLLPLRVPTLQSNFLGALVQVPVPVPRAVPREVVMDRHIPVPHPVPVMQQPIMPAPVMSAPMMAAPVILFEIHIAPTI